jgi:glycosyltransferase involved in cell wall biosynthesis
MLQPLFPRGIRVLVRQNTTVSEVLNEGRVPFYTRAFYRLLYRRADRILCQTKAMAEDLKKTLRVPAEKIAILLNPIEIPSRVDLHAERDDKEIQLLAVGRLAHEKGFDLLLRAFASLLSEFPELRLRIAGVGPEEKSLRALCGELNLEERVVFAGFMKEPFRGAQIFVLSSRFEGMPNALLEAAAYGLPIVATPCSEGVVELLRGEPGVWLAAAVSADALSNSMRSALVALETGQRFEHEFMEPFRFERAIEAYERVIDEELAR